MGLRRSINHGITSMSAAIKGRGHDCKLIQIQKYSAINLLKQIREICPDIIGISLTENHHKQMEELGGLIKAQLGLKIFVGGPFPSAYPEWINECEWIDGLCLGEGEKSFTEVITKISKDRDYKDTLGFWFSGENGIIKNDLCPLDADLDSLPFPDIEIFDRETILTYPAFSFSRGCPFKCTYCCAPLFQERFGKETRFKSAERAIQEIKHMIGYCNPDILYFDDDTFFKSREWLVKFIRLYKIEINKPFCCNTRPETVNEEMVVMLKDANCTSIGIGLESGDEGLRMNMLSRQTKDEKTIDAFEICKRVGINTMTFNMVGIPGETKIKFEKTIELNKRIVPYSAQLTIFYPYRGTVLGELAYKEGYVVRRDGHPTFFGRGILSLPEFSLKEIESSALWFHYKVYKDTNYKKACYLLFRDYLMRYRSLFRMAQLLLKVITVQINRK